MSSQADAAIEFKSHNAIVVNEDKNQPGQIAVNEGIRKICSHDIKSPLTAILESCAMLFDSSADNPMEQSLLQNINDAVAHVFEMVDNMHLLVLMQEKSKYFKTQKINVRSCIQSVKNSLRYKLNEKKNHLIVKSQSEQVFVHSDTFKIRGNDFIFSTLVKRFLDVLIQEAKPESELMVEIVYDHYCGIKFSGNVELSAQRKNILNALMSRSPDYLKDFEDWHMIYRLMKIINVSLTVKYGQNPGSKTQFILQFSTESIAVKNCVNG